MVHHAFFPPLFASQTLQTEIFLILTNRIPQPESSVRVLNQSHQPNLQPTTIQTS
ncbi:hypothetical protein [Scardovia inopinata]|uniref:hypothetical protein n=1 Tax=Scardovia inopinata TaxID=78259 RepID=UPI0005FCB783|nr:hypothetical protein [Scardovia inopinata]BAR07104.1 hypothetical protein SCIP_1037 [Scardovia inopinata JCM 12537]